MTHRILMVAALLAAFVTTDVSAHDGLPHEIAELTERIVDDPSNPQLLLQRADLWRIEDGFDRALADLERARRLGADEAEVTLLKGRVLYEARRPEDALVALDAHLALRPGSFLGHWYRARARRAAGDADGALVDYGRAVELGTTLELFTERGALLEEREDFRAAARNYRMALQRLGESDLMRESLWRAEMAAKRFKAATAAIEPVLGRAQVRTRWLLMRADARAADGDRRGALADRQLALADVDEALKKRRSPMLLVQRAAAHRALGRLDLALADAEEAAKRAPKYAAAVRLHAELRKEVSR